MLSELNKIDFTIDGDDHIALVITDGEGHDPETREKLFQKKVAAYLKYVLSSDFKEKYNQDKRIDIKLMSPVEPTSKMQKFMQRVNKLDASDERFKGRSISSSFEQMNQLFGGPPVNETRPPVNENPNTQLGTHSGDSQAILDRGPALIFVLVAAADGKVDKKEMKAFASVLVAADAIAETSPAFGRSLDLERSGQAVGYYAEKIQNGLDPIEELKELRDAIDSTLSPEEAQQFKMGLIFVGKQIAEASGGFLGIFGSKISKEEKIALAAIIGTLNPQLKQ